MTHDQIREALTNAAHGKTSLSRFVTGLRMQARHGCGDHSCEFLKPTGIGTNGGCRCWKRIESWLYEFMAEHKQAILAALPVEAPPVNDIRPTVELLRLGERAARYFADGTRTDEELDVETALKCLDAALGALEALPVEETPPDLACENCGHVFAEDELANITADDVPLCRTCYDACPIVDTSPAVERITGEEVAAVLGATPVPYGEVPAIVAHARMPLCRKHNTLKLAVAHYYCEQCAAAGEAEELEIEFTKRKAQPLPVEAPTTCAWTEDEDGNWHTGCGHMFTFNEDGPVENKQRFCGYCGRGLVEVRLPAPPTEDQ